VLLGNGNGTFQAQQTLAAGPTAFSVVAADVNGDGRLDLVVGTPGFGFSPASTMSVLLGNGNGTFQAQQTLAAGSRPFSVAVADVNGDGRADVVVSNYNSNNLSVLLSNSNGSFTGQIYTIVPPADTITGTGGNDTIMLTRDADGTDIDWTMGASNGQLPINDPRGLTINGNGGGDTIMLNYGASNANPQPNTLHLNGTFTINGLTGSNPLANTNLEIGRSTVYISYSSSPLSLIQSYLRNGYNNGGWNGTPTASAGAITSIPAHNSAAQTTAVGYADSANGLIPGQPANTIELKYTLYGDTTLAGTVGFNDFTRMTQHWNQTTGGTWDTGDFNYDGSVNSADFTLMTRTYNTSVGNQALPAVAATPTGAAVGSTGTSSVPTPSTGSGQASSPQAAATAPTSEVPVVQVSPPPALAQHKKPVREHKHRHR
jgi:hypothetical protein